MIFALSNIFMMARPSYCNCRRSFGWRERGGERRERERKREREREIITVLNHKLVYL